MINKPFRKEEGKAFESFVNIFPNRKKRRAHLQRKSFTGNQKGVSLVTIGREAYFRYTQRVDGKTILHYKLHTL